MESHLLQMRGLKPEGTSSNGCKGKSHLLQMRGLKLCSRSWPVAAWSSHLLQMRGLKHRPGHTDNHRKGRIFYRCVD